MIFTKRLFAGLLLSIAIIPLAWCCMFFGAMLVNQMEVSETLEGSHHLQTLTLSNADVKWVKKNKEILVEGKYFDVKHFKIKGNQIVVTGFYDTKENALSKEIAGVFKTNEHQKQLLSQVVFLMFFCGAPVENSYSTHSPLRLANKESFPFFNEKEQDQCSPKTFRPPAAV